MLRRNSRIAVVARCLLSLVCFTALAEAGSTVRGGAVQAALRTSNGSVGDSAPRTFGGRGANPIIDDPAFDDLADPAVLEHKGRLYIYPTGTQTSFNVYHADLPPNRDADFDPKALVWTNGGTVFKSPHNCWLSTLIPALGKGTLTWAPHVMYHDATAMFYLYYSTCLQLRVAQSSSALGPFEDVSKLGNLAIDPFVLQAPGGRLYLYYSEVQLYNIYTGEERIYVRELATPTTYTAKTPAVQLIKPSQHPWEFYRSRWFAPRGINEGAWVLELAGVYYLMYSAAGADTEHYRIGYATSHSPLGPFVKYADNPINDPVNDPINDSHLAPSTKEKVFGPGHHSVWRDTLTGRHWAFYHQKRTAEVGWDRFICVDELTVGGGRLAIGSTRG